MSTGAVAKHQMSPDTGRPNDPAVGPIDVTLLERPVEGHQLRGESLGELINTHDTLLVFLRHFG